MTIIVLLLTEVSIEFYFKKTQGDSEGSQFLNFLLKINQYQPISVDLFKDVDRIELKNPNSDILLELPIMQVVLKSTSTLCCHPLIFSDSAFVKLNGSSCFAVAFPYDKWSLFQNQVRFKK